MKLSTFTIYGIFLGILSNTLQAQVDTEFWFVVPKVFSESGEIPLTLVVSSIGTAESVQISQPANPAFPSLSVSLTPFEVEILDLTEYQEELVNTPAKIVLNKGLHIRSSGPIMAYFHVEHPTNQDIFTLKGEDALGKAFFIPTQTDFRNRFGSSSFNIVATEDQTELQITPSSPSIGFGNGTPFQVSLDKGQTYTYSASGPEAEDHLAGSHILSNKPIAVTVSDDAIVNEGGSDWDLVGDQLLPLAHVGTEYLAMRGDATTERLYLLATQEDTEIYLPGTSQRVQLQPGETHAQTLTQASLYVESNKPVYAFQLSGYEDSPAGAILYPLSCTGTDIVKYVRPDGINFIKYLLTPTENISSFKLNGSDNVGPFYFSPAASTNQEWSIGRVEGLGGFTTSTNQLNNTAGIFHMGMVATTGEGASFAYFSDIHPSSTSQTQYVCLDQGAELMIRPGMENPTWSSGENSQTILVDSLETYWVEGEIAGCTVRDTIELKEIPRNWGVDTLLCPNESLEIQLLEVGGSYLWEDGEIKTSRSLSAGDTLAVQLSTEMCTLEDTIRLGLRDLPQLSLGPDTSICTGDSLLLAPRNQAGNFTWQDGQTTPEYVVFESGSYWVEQKIQGCSQRDTIFIREAIAADVQLTDTSLCLGDSLVLAIDLAQLPFQWEDGFTEAIRSVTQSGIYTAYVQGDCLSAPYSWEVQFEDCSCKPFLPNAFSPNNDGINDIFFPELSCPLEFYELTVFNRWGEIIFQSPDLQRGWQGQNGSWQAPETVYFYQIHFKSSKETEPRMLSGQVLLLR
ncbi:MAG: gliding motility-associated C-terminal domain-containing protein [Bacteroidota bacterium]